MISVVFDPDARAEFLEAVQYYEDCQAGLGRRFRMTVEAAVQSISGNPFRYRVLHAPFRRYLLPNFPYSIISLLLTRVKSRLDPQHFLQTGRIEKPDLIDAPFTRLHPKGIRGVFSPEEIDEILRFSKKLLAA